MENAKEKKKDNEKGNEETKLRTAKPAAAALLLPPPVMRTIQARTKLPGQARVCFVTGRSTQPTTRPLMLLWWSTRAWWCS